VTEWLANLFRERYAILHASKPSYLLPIFLMHTIVPRGKHSAHRPTCADRELVQISHILYLSQKLAEWPVDWESGFSDRKDDIQCMILFSEHGFTIIFY
jgi:hypothetical protein